MEKEPVCKEKYVFLVFSFFDPTPENIFAEPDFQIDIGNEFV